MTEIETKAATILEQLTRDGRLGRYVDASLPIPRPYRGSGEIRLIVLGQDPTIKDATQRSAIQVVLNLDKNGSVPVITLGEPILAPLVHNGVPARVRHYWGYTPDWRAGRLDPFLYIRGRDNRLGRDLFPFPHQPSLRKLFYKARIGDYVAFMKAAVFSETNLTG